MLTGVDKSEINKNEYIGIPIFLKDAFSGLSEDLRKTPPYIGLC
jgi:hypothetical protein